MVISSGSSWDNIPTVPCTNQLIGGPDSVTAPIQEDKEAAFKRSHSASDITIEEESKCVAGLIFLLHNISIHCLQVSFLCPILLGKVVTSAISLVPKNSMFNIVTAS